MMPDGPDAAGDIGIARSVLTHDPNVKVAAARNGRLLGCATGRGIRPLLDLAERLGGAMRGASVADRVVGRAAAFVLIVAGAARVYGETLSSEAATLLASSGIPATGEHIVPRIMRPDGSGPCVMEELVHDVADPDEAVTRLRRFLDRGSGPATSITR